MSNLQFADAVYLLHAIRDKTDTIELGWLDKDDGKGDVFFWEDWEHGANRIGDPIAKGEGEQSFLDYIGVEVL